MAHGGTRFEGFTDQERGAMQDRAKELHAAARRRPRAHQAHQADQAHQDAERQPLDRLAELPAADRALAQRLHAIVTATAPALAPRLRSAEHQARDCQARDGQ